jgi:hypothetical protein
VLGCVQGFKECLLAADPAVPWSVLTIIRIVVSVDERGFGVKILALRLSHGGVFNNYTKLSTRLGRCEVESYDRVRELNSGPHEATQALSGHLRL